MLFTTTRGEFINQPHKEMSSIHIHLPPSKRCPNLQFWPTCRARLLGRDLVSCPATTADLEPKMCDAFHFHLERKKTNKTQICKPYKSVHRLLVKLSLPFGLRKPSGADADEAGWTWASVISVKLLRCSTSTQERERERKWTNLDNWWKEIKNFGLLFDPPFLRVGFTAHASSAAWKLVPFVSVSLHPAILTQQQQRKKTFRHQAFPSTSQLQPS